MRTDTYDETKYRLVPIEATKQMLDFMRSYEDINGNLHMYPLGRESYAEMLAAAPAVPEER